MLYRGYHIMAQELAVNKNLYYEAMERSARQSSSEACEGCPITAFRKVFSYGFKPDYMLDVINPSKKLIRQMKVLYGASQLDN